MTVLDELNEIKELVNNNKHFKYKNIVNFNCDSIEKSLKALEIIKEKKINVEQFYLNFIKSGFGYHYYLEKWYKFQSTDNKKLTEEEFNLLKEVEE